MTRRFWIATLFLAVACAGIQVSAHDDYRFVGTVVKMDTGKGQLTFKTKEEGKDLTLVVSVTAKTSIEKDGKKASRTDLKAGVSVVVDCSGDSYDDLEGFSIKIVPAPGK